jgi:hypothetical protein
MRARVAEEMGAAMDTGIRANPALARAFGVDTSRVDGAAPMDVEASTAAAAPDPPITHPRPRSRRASAPRCVCLPAALQEQLAALEAANMAGFERNSEPFADYFRRWDLTAHVMTLASGEVVGLAITGAEGCGKMFLYELHVAAAHHCCGYATALLELTERSSTSRSASATTIESSMYTRRMRLCERARLLRAHGVCGDWQDERRRRDCDAQAPLGPHGDRWHERAADRHVIVNDQQQHDHCQSHCQRHCDDSPFTADAHVLSKYLVLSMS